MTSGRLDAAVRTASPASREGSGAGTLGFGGLVGSWDARAMRTIDEVRALASELVSGQLVDRAVDAVVPAWYLVEDPDGPVRIGGPAPLAPGEAWPVGEHGVALTFVAALPLAALPQLAGGWADRVGWRHQGETLRIFADLVANPHEPAPALVLPTDPEATVILTDAPQVPDPWPAPPDFDLLDVEPDVRVRELPEVRASFVAGLTVDEFALGLVDDEDDADTREEFTDAIWHHDAPDGFSKVGGAPRWTMDDPRDAEGLLTEDPGDMVIVLELHSIGEICPPRTAAPTSSVPPRARSAPVTPQRSAGSAADATDVPRTPSDQPGTTSRSGMMRGTDRDLRRVGGLARSVGDRASGRGPTGRGSPRSPRMLGAPTPTPATASTARSGDAS